ncbi:acyl-CoA dehydrogenase family protein [Gordonia sp. HY285]|uniref:Acyl-CoA dehydrogenase family protein n=1 Tax=Gordonia liuliyuniae TaxID=2911517 RepID=A0ABS9ITR5_9ACTN|nr:acyl-CoA dehydrogenase family protein [Gordonia liuliyuniae]MCF8588949.1 acyl-CoA dehydrogenase family protein [Gordonia liuliyuniae]MCF8609170.1 acyl-CoA dehydrogenase family protein [Gordonia liuliyuniae]
MDITYPAAAEEYRVQIRTLLESELPDDWQGIGALPFAEQEVFLKNWRKVLSDNGLLAVSWPKEVGGAGLSGIEQVVLNEELMRLGVPDGTENDTLGIKLLGNTIGVLGTDEQKEYFLPRVLSGEHVWCQGYSEPEAGSDLAGMRTRAVRDGDEWVINGQKTWTSQGHSANWIFVIARTDPTVAKHKGLSFLLVPMDQPGVEVRPILNAAGYVAFSEVFFTDARTPVTHVLGEVGGGWKTANTLLGFERGVRATTDAVRFGREVERLIELARERGLTDDPRIRAELAWCWSRVQTMRFRGYRALTKLLNGGSYGVDGSFSKVIWSEFFQRLTEIGMEILGLEALTPSGAGNDGILVTPNPGTDNSSKCWTDIALYARAATIYGGSSQIQRNIIGEQLLGLPKEPRLDGGPFQDIGRRQPA